MKPDFQKIYLFCVAYEYEILAWALRHIKEKTKKVNLELV